MTEGKPVTVNMLGSGKAYDAVVHPGETPRDVLARTIDGDHDQAFLRSGTGQKFPPDTDLHEAVDKKEVLYTGTDPVVGRHR